MPHPEFPVVEGRYQMTTNWAVTLPRQYKRRTEGGSLVFWRPGITAWIIVWNNDRQESQQERLEWLCGGTPPDAFEAESVAESDVTWYSYRLTERRDDRVVQALYGFAIGTDSHVQIAIYFDDEADLETAREIYRSLDETPNA